MGMFTPARFRRMIRAVCLRFEQDLTMRRSRSLCGRIFLRAAEPNRMIFCGATAWTILRTTSRINVLSGVLRRFISFSLIFLNIPGVRRAGVERDEFFP